MLYEVITLVTVNGNQMFCFSWNQTWGNTVFRVAIAKILAFFSVFRSGFRYLLPHRIKGLNR